MQIRYLHEAANLGSIQAVTRHSAALPHSLTGREMTQESGSTDSRLSRTSSDKCVWILVRICNNPRVPSAEHGESARRPHESDAISTKTSPYRIDLVTFSLERRHGL